MDFISVFVNKKQGLITDSFIDENGVINKDPVINIKTISVITKKNQLVAKFAKEIINDDKNDVNLINCSVSFKNVKLIF